MMLVFHYVTSHVVVQIGAGAALTARQIAMTALRRAGKEALYECLEDTECIKAIVSVANDGIDTISRVYEQHRQNLFHVQQQQVQDKLNRERITQRVIDDFIRKDLGREPIKYNHLDMFHVMNPGFRF